MAKLTSRAMLLLILSILALSIIPVVSAAEITITEVLNEDDDPLTADDQDKGSEIHVFGEDVTSGFDVKLYWDNPAKDTWDSTNGEGLLNTTEADADGTFEIWFEVPESVADDHYLWVEDTKTGDLDSWEFIVLTKLDAPTSSLPEEEITVKGYGFGKEKDVVILLSDGSYPFESETGEILDTGDGSEDTFSGKTDENPIVPGSVTITAGAMTLTDEGDGDLVGAGVDDASINYATGDWEIEFDDPLGDDVDIVADYDWYDDVEDVLDVLSTAVTTNKVGSFSKSVDIPDWDFGDYEIYAYDEKDNNDDDDFDIGSQISLDVESAPVGGKVQIRGEGFTQPNAFEYAIEEDGVTIDGLNCYVVDAPVFIKSTGKFTLDIIIAGVDDEDDDYDIVVSDNGTRSATFEDFEVTGLPSIEIDPMFGAVGSKIEVHGYNFSALEDEEVELILDGDVVEDFETDENGEFSGTFTVPAIDDDTYEITAQQADFNIEASEDFRVGLMVVILTPNEGPAGKLVSLTGLGFTENGEWNATMGDEDIFEDEQADGTGKIRDEFYVPSLPVGSYDVVITDVEEEIQVVVEFDVDNTTTVILDPSSAPQDFNVTIEAEYFGQDDSGLEWVIYNITSDGDIDFEDDMEVWVRDYEDVEIDTERGNFTAWWDFNDEDLELDIGDYWVNVTDGHDMFVQVPFSVVAEINTAESHKSAYAIGDVVSFDITTNFKRDDTWIEVFDPDGVLYWKLEFVEDDFESVDHTYTVPIMAQADAKGNLLELTNDAPIGTWTWEWWDEVPDDDDELMMTGSFTVSIAPEAALEERLTGVETAISGLSSSVSDLGTKADAAAADSAAAKAAAESAKSSAESAAEAIGDIADTADNAKSAADAAKSAADAAKTSADEAKTAASGLSSLVYVAIGASVIAALAAIFAVMQIGRKIAG
jgi:hypothetical protein